MLSLHDMDMTEYSEYGLKCHFWDVRQLFLGACQTSFSSDLLRSLSLLECSVFILALTFTDIGCKFNFFVIDTKSNTKSIAKAISTHSDYLGVHFS